MRIKNIGLPFLICAVTVLFLLYVPEKIPDIYDEATIGKPTVSKVKEETAGYLPVIDRIKLIDDYRKNADIICIEEVHSDSGMEKGRLESLTLYYVGELKQPSGELVMDIQEELDRMKQLSLLPEISLDNMKVSSFSFLRYMDIRDENRYLALASISFRKEATEVWVQYDIENKKILLYSYYSDTMTIMEEDELVQKGWSDYLGISLEETKRYYHCGWYKDAEIDLYGVQMIYTSFLY